MNQSLTAYCSKSVIEVSVVPLKTGWQTLTGNPRTCAPAPPRAGVLFALFMVGCSTFLNLYATQPLLPQFRQLFHASELAVSLTVSAPVLAVALAGPLLGVLADSLGRKRVIVSAMLALALLTALSATAGSLTQLVAWRFGQGFVTPGIVAVAMAYISEESPPRLAGSTMATYITGGVVGGFLGRFLAGLIAARWGWQTAMMVLGTATFAGALAIWRLLPRSRNFVRHSGFAAPLQSMRDHLHNRQLLATYWVGFNVLFCLVGAFTYVNFYLTDAPFHLGPVALSSIFGVYLVGAAITPVTGRILDRVGCRTSMMAAAVLAAVGIILTIAHSTPIVIAGLAITASGAFACQSAASSHVGKAASKARSSASGLYVGFYYLGGCCGSIVPGLLWKQAGWIGCVTILALMQTITVVVAYRYWKE